MTPDSKSCPICTSAFGRTNGISNERWRQQVTCSRACSVKYRRGKQRAAPAGAARSKRAMNTHWQRQKAVAAAKAMPIPIRPSREDEEDAIARFVAERGVTRAPPGEHEIIPARQETHRPQPMAGWRG